MSKPLSPVFPTIRELARKLREAKMWCEEAMMWCEDEGGIDVRLQVTESGWALRTGDPSYDPDHRGWWGAGYLTRRSNIRDLARDLIEEAREDLAQWYLPDAG